MRFDSARHSLIAAMLAAGATFIAGCSLSADAGSDEPTEASTDAIVDINHSKVKRQSIGNCWLYATASWAESLNKSANAGNAEMNMSESYWTYWHWFDQIANGGTGDEISTGGHYSTAAEIIARYGVISEGAFIADESADEMSARQASALTKINASLKSGALSSWQARQNRSLVRQELDAAWELDASVVAQLDKVFGAGVTKTFDKSTVSTTGTSIKRAKSIKALLRDPDTKQTHIGTLQDAIGTRSSSWGPRTGKYAWQQVSYPSDATARRDMQVRVQKAMHDKQPVVMSWYVDFNALDDYGRFMAPPTEPGRQGGHMVVVEDYQINDVPGYGTLKAGVEETRQGALDAALDPSAKIEFIRIKNSWGAYRPDRQFIVPGYHDLYMQYLDGPIKQCTQNADDTDSTSDCWDDTPLNDFVLPPGY
jgi:hypothetical protein